VRRRLTIGWPPFGTCVLIAAVGLCLVALACEFRAVYPLSRDRAQRLELSPAAPTGPGGTARTRHRHAHRGSRDRATAAFERGVAAFNADDVDGAADAFEEAVRLAPTEPEPRINLGLVYLRLQRSQDAMRELTTGASLAERQQRR
jgi:Flp pilus assembly protein TadD